MKQFKELQKVSEIMLSISELEVLFDESDATLRKLLSRLVPERGPKESLLYPLKDVTDAILKKDPASMAQVKLEREKNESEVAAARAYKLRLEGKALDGSVVSLKEAEKMFADIALAFKARLLAIPSKSAHTLKSVKDQGEMEKHLMEAIGDALNELTRKPKRNDSGSIETTTETYY